MHSFAILTNLHEQETFSIKAKERMISYINHFTCEFSSPTKIDRTYS